MRLEVINLKEDNRYGCVFLQPYSSVWEQMWSRQRDGFNRGLNMGEILQDRYNARREKREIIMTGHGI